MDLITKLDLTFREKLNPILGPLRYKKLSPENRQFTIIANDCWAGHVYRYFNLPYDSPTVGTGFFADDYLKFITNLREYIEMDIQMITAKESIHYAQIMKHHPKFHNCPYARIGDIEVRFGHYHDPDEAKEKWDKRKKRIHWDNLIFKMSEHNSCTFEIMQAFDALPYQKKVLFTTRDYGFSSQVIYKEYLGKDDIKNNTAQFRKYVNLINLINGKPFKKNQ